MVDIFTPPKAPSIGTSQKVKFEVNVTEFGDGFRETSPKGLNNKKRSVSPVWGRVSAIEKSEITDFLDAQAGARKFQWSYPGEAASNWRCEGYSVSDLSGGIYKISTEFEWAGWV